MIFGATAFAVQWSVIRYYQEKLDQSGADVDVLDVFSMPTVKKEARETETGLFLSGMIAQGRRDWDMAWQSYSKLHEKYSDNPDFALRAFTLALGNGDYIQAAIIADGLHENLIDMEGELKSSDKYDLMRLFLVLRHVKNAEWEQALSLANIMDKGPLAGFSRPIIESWVRAEFESDALEIFQSGRNALQFYYKALAAEYAGKNDMALSLMNKVQPDSMTSGKLADIAEFYARIGKETRAIQILKRGLVRFNRSDRLGEILQKLESDNENGQVEFVPQYKNAAEAIAAAHHDFAQIMGSENALDSTLLFARLAAYLNPENPDFHLTIASVLQSQGRLEQAFEAYRKVPSDHHDYSRALSESVVLLSDKDKIEEAEILIRQAIESAEASVAHNNNMPFYHYLLGNILREQKDYIKAIEAYDTAEQLARAQNDGELPQNLWSIYYTRAIAYDLSDQWEKAEADLLIALEKLPENPIILNYLGYSYADKNINLQKAKDMISRAVMAAPNDAYIIDSMGWILYRKGEYAQAVKYLERAAALKPYHMVINAHLGDALWKVGRKIEAYYMWQRAVDYYDETDEEQARLIDDTRRKAKHGMGG